MTIVAKTTGASVCSVIEQAGLGIKAWRDEAKGDVFPRAVVTEGISIVPVAIGTGAVKGSKRWVSEECQIDLWQRVGEENYALTSDLLRALVESVYPRIGDKAVGAVRVGTAVRRPPEPGSSAVRTIIPVVLVHAI